MKLGQQADVAPVANRASADDKRHKFTGRKVKTQVVSPGKKVGVGA
jgi:hypothetical protein